MDKIVCPYCESEEKMQLGNDYYMCLTCKGKYLSINNIDNSEPLSDNTICNDQFGANIVSSRAQIVENYKGKDSITKIWISLMVLYVVAAVIMGVFYLNMALLSDINSYSSIAELVISFVFIVFVLIGFASMFIGVLDKSKVLILSIICIVIMCAICGYAIKEPIVQIVSLRDMGFEIPSSLMATIIIEGFESALSITCLGLAIALFVSRISKK